VKNERCKIEKTVRRRLGWGDRGDIEKVVGDREGS
jgi:hypothetical protein